MYLNKRAFKIVEKHLKFKAFLHLLAHSWHTQKIVGKIPAELCQKNIKPATGLEPQKSLNRGNMDGF